MTAVEKCVSCDHRLEPGVSVCPACGSEQVVVGGPGPARPDPPPGPAQYTPPPAVPPSASGGGRDGFGGGSVPGLLIVGVLLLAVGLIWMVAAMGFPPSWEVKSTPDILAGEIRSTTEPGVAESVAIGALIVAGGWIIGTFLRKRSGPGAG